MTTSIHALGNDNIGPELGSMARGRDITNLHHDARVPIRCGPHGLDHAPQGIRSFGVRREEPEGCGPVAREDGRRRRAEVGRCAFGEEDEADADGEVVCSCSGAGCREQGLHARELFFELGECGRAGFEGSAALYETWRMGLV